LQRAAGGCEAAARYSQLASESLPEARSVCREERFIPLSITKCIRQNFAGEVEWYHGMKPFRLYTDERAYCMCEQQDEESNY